MNREQLIREAIVAEAFTWLRTPYHHEGAVKGVGADCCMMPLCVYQSQGFLVGFDPRPYAAEWHMHRNEELYLEGLASVGARRVESPKLADIAMFQFGRTVSHASIIIDLEPLTFIHSYIGQGCVMAQLSEIDYSTRLHSFWSIFP